jgi:hypothetical protein
MGDRSGAARVAAFGGKRAVTGLTISRVQSGLEAFVLAGFAGVAGYVFETGLPWILGVADITS